MRTKAVSTFHCTNAIGGSLTASFYTKYSDSNAHSVYRNPTESSLTRLGELLAQQFIIKGASVASVYTAQHFERKEG